MQTPAKVHVGVIGCGNISPQYFNFCRLFGLIDIVACADLDIERARARAQEFGVPRACSVDELLASPDVQIVLNLTVPKAHAQLNLAAIKAGKHVYCEKPLGIDRMEGEATLAAAAARGVRLGCAPDTFLGGGIQTCRKLIDEGQIGQPLAATAFMTCPGHESWHPSPEFYYEVGGGPMLDMGPYYLTALVNLLGPVARVAGSAQALRTERLITSQPKSGQRIAVETPTHIAGVMDFENGAVGTIIQSFDVHAANLPRIEIYGTQGSLSVPDPNGFGGPVRLYRASEGQWENVPLSHSDQVGRGIGVADMAYGLTYGRPHRASGELAAHVLEVMTAFEASSKAGAHVHIQSRPQRPRALPVGLAPGQLDK